MTSLLSLLEQLEADGLTGRVNVTGSPSGWVYLHEGLVYCAEREDRPRMVVAMAEEGLFTPDEWQLALRIPSAHKWRALVDDDDVRLYALGTFARRYTEDALSAMAMGATGAVFAPAVAHPFGPLRRWPPADVLTVIESKASPEAGGTIDLTSLLLEISPLVRVVDRRLVAG